MTIWGITRMDYTRTHGWYVRVYLTGKRTHNRFFADLKNGGRLEALSVAMAYRDKYMREHEGEIRPSVIRKKTFLPSNNTSGMLGINFYHKLTKDKTRREPVYQVTWTSIESGKICRHTKPFYVKNYPSDGAARDAAIVFRKNWEASVP